MPMRLCWCIALRCGAIDWNGGCASTHSSIGYELAHPLACVYVITADLLSNREGNFGLEVEHLTLA